MGSQILTLGARTRYIQRLEVARLAEGAGGDPFAVAAGTTERRCV